MRSLMLWVLLVLLCCSYTESACGDHSDCASCVDDPDCGFCSGAKVQDSCLAGDANGPHAKTSEALVACGLPSYWRFDQKDRCGKKSCQDYTGCNECANDPLCGWCFDSQNRGFCSDGNACEINPALGTTCLDAGWWFDAFKCAGPVRCDKIKNCDQCLSTRGCGWCELTGQGDHNPFCSDGTPDNVIGEGFNCPARYYEWCECGLRVDQPGGKSCDKAPSDGNVFAPLPTDCPAIPPWTGFPPGVTTGNPPPTSGGTGQPTTGATSGTPTTGGTPTVTGGTTGPGSSPNPSSTKTGSTTNSGSPTTGGTGINDSGSPNENSAGRSGFASALIFATLPLFFIVLCR